MSEVIDEKVCPLCQKPNHCGQASGDSFDLCWCAIEKFPREIFALVPPEKLHKACICKECLNKFKQKKL